MKWSQRYRATGSVSHNAMWQFLRREGLRFKKTLFAVEQARSDVARLRRRRRSWQAGLDPRECANYFANAGYASVKM